MSIDNNLLDESYQVYIKSAIELTDNYYRVYDNNCDTDRVVINGKIDNIVNLPKNINNIFNIDVSCGNIVHIPMVSDIYIEYLDIKKFINIKNLNSDQNLNSNSNFDSYNNSFFSDTLKIYSVKTKDNIIYQDIIIQTNNTIIIIQVYKFKNPIKNITHGAFIIYQDEVNNMNSNNTIYYTRNNRIKNKIDKLDDTTNIYNKKYIKRYMYNI